MSQHVPNSEANTLSVLRDYRGKGNFLTSDEAEHSLKVWRKSKLYREVSQLLTPGSADLAHEESEWEPVKLRDHEESIFDHGSSPSFSGPHEVPAVCDMPIASCQVQSLTNWSIPENTPDLLDFYFTYTHCWFPILERRELLRAMHVSSSQSTSDPTPSHTSLWPVIIYSCIMKGIHNPRLPTLPAIQLYAQQPLLSGLERLELGHIQSILVIVLTHIALGNIDQAWILVGQATRMLATLPLAQKGRFTHTFNGCVLLDSILSALLGKTPSLSSEEQLQQGPVEEDDVDEWDVWSVSRTKSPATPLHALSTFNSIRHLTQGLSQISYSTSNASNFEDLADNLQQQQEGILQHRPYNRDGYATPPLLTLHLTSAFTTLSLIRKFQRVSSAILALCVRTIYYSLGMLDHYMEMTGRAGSSPLVYCFALQCQRSIEIITSVLSSAEKETLEKRIHGFLHSVKPNGYLEGRDWLQHAIASVTAAQSDQHNESLIPIASTHNTIASQVNLATLGSRPQPPDTTLPDLPSTSDTTCPVGGGAEEYDALFEEMMTVGSFPPGRYAPSFTLCLIGF
jgi:hypothetical protein